MKSTYEAPRLTTVGSIKDLTLGGGGWGGLGGWGGHEHDRTPSPRPSHDCFS